VRVLVAEDDVRTATLLRSGLEREGHEVFLVDQGEPALLAAKTAPFDVIILDAILPGVDGFEVCKKLRDSQVWTPILMLTGRSSIDDRVKGLDAGADDYLTKPFAFSELFARIRAIVRRDGNARPMDLVCGDLVVDPISRRVVRGETSIHLSPRELALLEEFMRHQGMTLTRDDLRARVWEDDGDAASNVVDVYVRYLRERIDRPFGRNSLQTVRGEGYKLVDDTSAQ
jgi:two-component system OmpR family response regulator